MRIAVLAERAAGESRVAITPETAIKLERALGMPVEYWLNLEAHYQETQARLAEAAEKLLPVRCRAEQAWLMIGTPHPPEWEVKRRFDFGG